MRRFLCALALATTLTTGCLAPSDLSTSNEAFSNAVAAVIERRAAEGQPIEAPLSTQEWAYILLTVAGSAVSLNAYRSVTRKKALAKAGPAKKGE